jgi:ABC-2 type transport system permease protein
MLRMSPVLLIARRELGAYLRTMTGWIVATAVLLIDGLLFNAFALEGARRSTEVLTRFFYFASGPTMVAAIFLAMRLLAEERQSGTLSLLYASPVRDRDIVLGKFLAALVFLAGFTLLTIYMPLLVLVHGKVSLGHLVAGYLGLILLGSASLALGTLGSALAPNQVVAAIVGGALLVSLLLAWLLARVTEPPFSSLFAGLALHNAHFPPFQAGTVHLRDVIYYGLVTWVALFAAIRVVEARRWR